MVSDEEINLRVCHRDGALTEHKISPGENLRAALIRFGLSPYEGKFNKLNCKGMGVCGTCKVLVREYGSEWERRSCQIQCFQDLEIRLK